MAVAGTSHPVRWLLCGAALLAIAQSAGCGARIGAVWPDSGVPPDAAPLPDAAQVPDAAGEGCWREGDVVTVVDDGAPAFVQTVTVIPNASGYVGRYLVAGAVGWQDIQARLWVVSWSDLSVISEFVLGEGMAYASYDWLRDEVVVAHEQNNDVALRRLPLSPAGELSGGPPITVCTQCTPAWAEPLVGEDAAAVAVEDFGLGTVRFHVVEQATGASQQSPDLPGQTPHLVHNGDGVLLLYDDFGTLLVQRYDWAATPLDDPTPLVSVPLRGLLTATNTVFADEPLPYHTDTGAAALLVGPADPPTLRLIRFDTDVHYISHEYDVTGGMGYTLPAALSRGDNDLALAWGETFGDGRVGAHFLDISAWTDQLVFGPELVSEPSSHSLSSYSIWAGAVPAFQGHVVFWGGWQTQSNYALYARRMGCRIFHETPPE